MAWPTFREAILFLRSQPHNTHTYTAYIYTLMYSDISV